MTEVTLDALLQDCKLQDKDLNEELKRIHFREISGWLAEWRVLSLKLPGFSEGVIDAIEADNGREDSRRLAFLKRLKQKLAVRATYRVLVKGLLDIERAEDARNLCSFLAELLQKPSFAGVHQHYDLTKTVEDIKDKFEKVVDDIEKSFKERNLDVSEIKSSLKFISECEKFQLKQQPDYRSDLFRAESLQELFFIFSAIWDYLNPGLLQFVVKKFGTEEDKEIMHSYLEELSVFRKTTKLGIFVETVYKMEINQTILGKNMSTVMVDNWKDKTLQDVEDYRVQVANQTNCEQFLTRSLPIRSSIAITFSMPFWIQLNLVVLYPLLSSFGAVQVFLNRDFIFECQPEGPGSDVDLRASSEYTCEPHFSIEEDGKSIVSKTPYTSIKKDYEGGYILAQKSKITSDVRFELVQGDVSSGMDTIDLEHEGSAIQSSTVGFKTLKKNIHCMSFYLMRGIQNILHESLKYWKQIQLQETHIDKRHEEGLKWIFIHLNRFREACSLLRDIIPEKVRKGYRYPRYQWNEMLDYWEDVKMAYAGALSDAIKISMTNMNIDEILSFKWWYKDMRVVVYSKSFTGQDMICQDDMAYTKWLKMLELFLKDHFYDCYITTDITKYSLKIRLSGTPINLQLSPVHNSPKELYHFLESLDPSERDRFSVCAAKWQVEFLEKQPFKVQYLLKVGRRRTNFLWKIWQWTSYSEYYFEYLVNLLIVKGFENDTLSVSNGIKTLVQQFDTLDITWPGHYYELEDYPSLLPSCPRIVDPANPSHNVLFSGLKEYHRNHPKYKSKDTDVTREFIQDIGHYYESENYPSLQSSRPRTVDPANPSHNVLLSGLKEYHSNHPKYKSKDTDVKQEVMQDISDTTWMKEIFNEIAIRLAENIKFIEP